MSSFIFTCFNTFITSTYVYLFVSTDAYGNGLLTNHSVADILAALDEESTSNELEEQLPSGHQQQGLSVSSEAQNDVPSIQDTTPSLEQSSDMNMSLDPGDIFDFELESRYIKGTYMHITTYSLWLYMYDDLISPFFRYDKRCVVKWGSNSPDYIH